MNAPAEKSDNSDQSEKSAQGYLPDARNEAVLV